MSRNLVVQSSSPFYSSFSYQVLFAAVSSSDAIQELGTRLVDAMHNRPAREPARCTNWEPFQTETEITQENGSKDTPTNEEMFENTTIIRVTDVTKQQQEQNHQQTTQQETRQTSNEALAMTPTQRQPNASFIQGNDDYTEVQVDDLHNLLMDNVSKEAENCNNGGQTGYRRLGNYAERTTNLLRLVLLHPSVHQLP